MSKIIDETGYIICPKVRANYDRICGTAVIGKNWGIEYTYAPHYKVRSAEAYLTLVLRLEAQGNWCYETATFREGASAE